MKDRIKDLRSLTGLSQAKLADKYGIPFRTYQDWELGNRKPPEYVYELLRRAVVSDFKIK